MTLRPLLCETGPSARLRKGQLRPHSVDHTGEILQPDEGWFGEAALQQIYKRRMSVLACSCIIGHRHEGRNADVRSARKLKWATRRKRTLGAALQSFSVCKRGERQV